MLTAGTTKFDITSEPLASCLRDCSAVFSETRAQPAGSDRFDWLYARNPQGNALVWVARDNTFGNVVGFTAALPRQVVVEGDVRNCWIGADFSVLPSHRTLGLALKLRRAARQAIDDGRADFLYAHPNDRMAVIHARVGHRPIGTMIRLAKPLRIGPFIAERISSPRVGAIAGGILDPIRRWTDVTVWRRGRFTVRPADVATVDERFDDLFRRSVAGFSGVVGVRDSRYLRWRYADNPLYRTEMLVAEDKDQLAGYLLFVREGDEVHVKDIFPMHEPEVVQALVAALTQAGYRAGWRSISMTMLETNPLRPVLQALGFRQRGETSQMFGYCPEDRPWSAAVYDKDAWWLTVGDRDV